MKRVLFALSLALCIVVWLPSSLAQQASTAGSTVVVPHLIRFAGVVKDSPGHPLTGVAGITFSLYRDQQGGTPLWLETQNAVLDANGRYEVLLGAEHSDGVPMDLFTSGEARWLGIQVHGQGAEQPRVLMVSVPYALKAADAETVGGLPPSAFVLATVPNANTGGSPLSANTTPQPLATGTTPVTTAGGKVNKLAKFDASADITSSLVFDNGTNVGIGNTAPGAKLDVSGTGIFRGALSLPASGVATAAAGKNSQPLNLTTSSFSSSTSKPVNQTFRWQAEPVGNNTNAPSGKLSLLFASSNGLPAETGLSISSKGLLSFAPGQTFPGSGSGTVTSVALSAPASDFTVSGSPVTSSGTLTFAWTKPPTFQNIADAIVKRDDGGNFSANNISATSVQANIGSNIGVALFGVASVDRGVQGSSGSGTGVNGTSNSGTGVTGSANSGTGVAGSSSSGVGVSGSSTSAAAVFGVSASGGFAVGGVLRNGNNQSIGVYGENDSTTGGKGVLGLSNGVEGFGVQGVAVGSSQGIGVGGSTGPFGTLAKSLFGTAPIGVIGDSDGIAVLATSDSGTGVEAISSGADGVDGTSHSGGGSGVTGSNDAGGDGVFGGVSNGGFAGFFFGNVDVDGTLSKGGGSFKIDHPLDPANKYLYHSFVESPDMMNIYNGLAVLNANGEALVVLPKWFEALNRDFRYQLTAIGAPGPNLYVAEKVHDNQFKIAGGQPGMEVSWQVTGIRHDPWAEAYRIPVEQDKPAQERGFYRNPELYGAPKEKGIAWARHPQQMKRIEEHRTRLSATGRNAP